MPRRRQRRGGEGGGGGGRTEEEKLLYLQQKAQAEEELVKKKEEMLTLFLRDKLQREERNTAVNLLKLSEGWRSILRQTRAAELRKDLDVLSQTFERQLDGLDDIIKSLACDLREAERQSAQVRRVHLQHVERLRDEQDKRLMVLQQQWEDGLQRLTSRLNSERQQMLRCSQQQRADLEDAKFLLEQRHRDAMCDIHREYSDSTAACQSAHEDQMAARALEGKMALMEKTHQNQETLMLHSNEAEEVDDLLRKNQEHRQTTEDKIRKVKELQDSVVQLRMKLSSSKTEKESTERDLTAARDEARHKTHQLRRQLTHSHAVARSKLVDLTVQSAAAAKKLQRVIAQGEKVLRVGELCQKLENVIPPPSAADHQRSSTNKVSCEFPELQQLTRRVNNALLHREDLRKQRGDLSRENRQLRLLLRQRLDTMTVGDHTLDGYRALLTVHRAPTTTAPQDTERRHTVVEAVYAIRKTP